MGWSAFADLLEGRVLSAFPALHKNAIVGYFSSIIPLAGAISRVSGMSKNVFASTVSVRRPRCSSGSAIVSLWSVLLALSLLAGCSGFRADPALDATAEELYADARESLDKSKWNTAIAQLRELESRFPYGKYAEQAQLDTAYAHYQNLEPELAITAAERFIMLHPTHSAVDYAYYLKGRASFFEDDSVLGRLVGQDDLSDRDATAIRRALGEFRDVYTLFPQSRYAADAKARARHLLDALAQHEITVAGYYFSRQAHVAAVHRAKGVIEDFPDSPHVEDALGVLVHSYSDMGLDDLAIDARRILELNFPQSRYLTGERDELFAGRWYSGRLRDPGNKLERFILSFGRRKNVSE